MRLLYFLLLAGLVGMMNSCTSYEDLLNYEKAPGIPTTPQPITNFSPIKVQANDLLYVKISSADAVAIQPFLSSGGTSNTSSAYGEYLVSRSGLITLPTIGNISVEGLEIETIKARIEEGLSPYFNQQPIVEVRLANFKVNVNGEVNNPGTFSVSNERLTLIEALTLAGDFTDYARRDSVLIIREEGDMRQFGYVDFTSAEVFDSQYFYLQQNDVVYVKPNKTKINTVQDPARRFLPWISGVVSIAALIISISR